MRQTMLKRITVSLLLSVLVLASVAGSATAKPTRGLPKMLYPALDYGSRDGGLIWHRWIKPREWNDGDDVAVFHAHWTEWNRDRAAAHVRVSLDGQRGRGTVILSEPGYCPAAHAYGFLTEADRGGPWGSGGSFDLTEECAAHQRRAIRGSRTYVPQGQDAREPAYRPHRLLVAGEGSFFVGAMHWSYWRRRVARGTGMGAEDDCEPGCAEGTFHRAPARVRLYRPRRMCGHRVFTRMTLTWTDGQPNGVPHVGGRRSTSGLAQFGCE
jgi:hypothetical protein